MVCIVNVPFLWHDHVCGVGNVLGWLQVMAANNNLIDSAAAQPSL